MVLTPKRVILWLAAVAVLAMVFFMRPAQSAPFEVMNARPRLLLTPARLARLKERSAANEPRWAAFRRQCDSDLGNVSPYDVSVQNYALLYQVTGDVRYADKAIAIMQSHVDKGIAAISYDSGYGTRTVLPAMAIGYDWCYDRMTADQRTRFRAQMETWADWVWPETNPARASAWGVTLIGNNYYHGFLQTWLIGLALSGDSSKAAGYIEQARSRWLTKVRPYFDQYGEGGYTLEGTNYGTSTLVRICFYLEGHRTATGEAFLHEPGSLWAEQCLLAKLYLTTPDRKRLYPGGDQSRVSSAPIGDADRMSAVALLGSGPISSKTAGYVRHWLDTLPLSQTVTRADRWVEALWYPLDTSAVDYEKELAPSYLAAGSGLALFRSGWGADATYLTFYCGPTNRVGEDHQDLAQGEFCLWKRGWLVAPARVNSQAGLYRATEHHSTLMIGGKGQFAVRPELPKDRPALTRFADTEQYGYVEGEAADAYAQLSGTTVTPLLEGFRRHVLFLKPDRVVILDRVDALNPSSAKLWRVHLPSEPIEGDGSWKESAGGAELVLRPLLPPGAPVAKTPVNLGAGGARSSWKLEQTASVGNRLDTFLSVLDVGAAGRIPVPVRRIATDRGDLVGVAVGNHAALWEFASSPQAIRYETDVPEQILIGRLRQRYRLRAERRGSSGDPIEGVISPTDQGIISYLLPAGTWFVTLAPV